MIGAAEAHHMAALGVVAGEPHRLHHGFRAGHVEAHLVHARDRLEPRDIVRDDRMIGAQHRPELGDLRRPFRDHALIGVEAHQVDAVGAREIVEAVAVEIGDRHAIGGGEEAAGRKVLAHEAAELKGHAIGAGELQIGEAGGGLLGQRRCLGEALLVERGEALEAGLALADGVVRRAIRAEEALRIIAPGRDQPRHPARHARMAGKRAMLGPRQGEPRAALGGSSGSGERSGPPQEEWLGGDGGNFSFHDLAQARKTVTAS